MRRRVKEQQKRIGSAEFRNTQFSYSMGADGVEKFVATPELQSEDSIGTDPLPAGQVWAISPGGQDEGAGLYRIEVTEGPGGGVRILNQSPPAPFRESVKIAEQNLYARASELVGDRNPREHEFAVQLRSFDAAKEWSGSRCWGADRLCSSLLGKPLKGGLAVVGGINLGGSIEQVHNPIDVVELALEKGATSRADAGRMPSRADRSVRRRRYEGPSRFLPRCCGCASEGGPRGLEGITERR